MTSVAKCFFASGGSDSNSSDCKAGEGKALTPDECLCGFQGLECSSESRMSSLFLADNFLVFQGVGKLFILFSVAGSLFFLIFFLISRKASTVFSTYQRSYFSCSNNKRTIQEFNNA